MADGLAYFNGEYRPLADVTVSAFDQGFIHGDVVYDVISVWKGQFFRLDQHLDRFRNSYSAWQIPCDHDEAEIRTILAKCVTEGGVSDGAYVGIVATRGAYVDADAKRNRDITRTRGTFYAYAAPYAWVFSPEKQAAGISLIISKIPRIPEECVDSKVKNFHWADFQQGKLEARAAGADSSIHLSTEGYVAEGGGFNVFFVKNGRIFTPARNILLGVTRSAAIDLAREAGIAVDVADFSAQQLLDADEVFITSTAGGIIPIASIDGNAFPSRNPGSISSRLRDLYWTKREAGWCGTLVADCLASA